MDCVAAGGADWRVAVVEESRNVFWLVVAGEHELNPVSGQEPPPVLNQRDPVGLAFVRYVWKVEPIASMSNGEIVLAVAPKVQHFIDDNIAIPRKLRPRPIASEQ